MKKIKLLIMTLAIVFSVGAAFATRPHKTGDGTLYHMLSNGAFVPAGSFGVSYFCPDSQNTCTYTFDGAHYWPYMSGDYTPIN